MRAALCFLSFLVCLSTVVSAEQPDAAKKMGERISIVFDASGSMWGAVGSDTKIDVAKQVVSDVLKTWEPGTQVGLTVYGHRRKGDCSDIETLIPSAPLDEKRYTTALKSINPKGKTPLTAAVRHAAEELKYTEGKATVILVSDGLETCGADPCKTAQELEDYGVDFTAHVIGFDLSGQKDLSRLKCIAQQTGGKFMTADNADALKASFTEAVKEVKQKAAAPNVSFAAVETAGGTPVKVERWDIYRASEVQMNKPERVSYSYNATPQLILEPGRYVAKTVKAKAKAEKEFEVIAGQNQRVELVIASQGMVKFIAVNEPGGKPIKIDRWQVFTVVPDGSMEKPKRVEYKYDLTPEVTLLPGTYEIRAYHQKAEASQQFQVVPGKMQVVEVPITQQGLLKVVAVHEAGGAPLEKISRWEAFTIVAPDSMEKPKRVERGYSNAEERHLLPGRYRIDVNYQKSFASTEIEIMPGKLNTAEVVLPRQGMAKIVAVNQAGGAPLDKIGRWEIFEILPADSMKKPKRLERGYRNGEERFFMPATYRARVTFEKAQIETDFEVLPDKMTTVEVVLPEQGKLKLSAVREAGGDPVKVDRWEIYTSTEADSSQGAKRVDQNRSLKPEFTLLPGKYTARARLGQAEWTKSVEVAPGKIAEAEIVITEE